MSRMKGRGFWINFGRWPINETRSTRLRLRYLWVADHRLHPSVHRAGHWPGLDSACSILGLAGWLRTKA